MLLCSVAISAAIGFVLVLLVGDRYLRVIGRVDYARLCVAVLGVLLVLSYVFAGAIGVIVFLISTAVGFVPIRLGAARVHLMGVLIGPIALWYY